MATAISYARKSWLSALTMIMAVAAVVIAVVALATMPSAVVAQTPAAETVAPPSAIGAGPAVGHPIVLCPVRPFSRC